MGTPVAIRAVYADYRRIKTRKIHQIIFELPSELWPEAYAFLGEPNIENSDWHGIARLRPELETAALDHLLSLVHSDEPEPEEDDGATYVDEAPKWAPEHQHPAKQCALVCKRETFWQFLQETRDVVCENEEDAATYVRRFIGLNSRSDLARNACALTRWQFLESAYIDWLPRVA